jgi:hypothetical protein
MRMLAAAIAMNYPYLSEYFTGASYLVESGNPGIRREGCAPIFGSKHSLGVLERAASTL